MRVMWGPSFRLIFYFLSFETSASTAIAALTATATPQMEDAIIEALEMRNPGRVIATLERPELNLSCITATANTCNQAVMTALRLLRIRVLRSERPDISTSQRQLKRIDGATKYK